MAHISTDLTALYNTYFQQSYCLPIDNMPAPLTVFSQPVSKKYKNGVDVFLPVTLKAGNQIIDIPCATIRATCKKTVVRTAVSGRIGTVKEMYQNGDWEFTIKGILIAANGSFPDEEMLNLRRIYESTMRVELENALSDIFLDMSKNVCITSLDFPEVEGKNQKYRPFSLTCESDFVIDLRP